jgi:hypothetical protein
MGKTVAFVGKPCLSWKLLAEWLAYWGTEVKPFEQAAAAIRWFSQKPDLQAVIVDADSLQPADEQPLVDTLWMLAQGRHLPVLIIPSQTGRAEALRQCAARCCAALPRLSCRAIGCHAVQRCRHRPRVLTGCAAAPGG